MSRWSLVLALAALSCTPKAPPVAYVGATQATPKPLVAGEVFTRPGDTRAYRHFELDNGMKVLVISDPDADMAAAALNVHIGQFSDPADREGLAHFLEHMLFMGTDTYPDVDDYRRFIQDHGGRSNAGTGQEHTNYYFSVGADHLEGALDRFSRFFVAPKLDPEFVKRERNAVHSEYQLKVRDDIRRIREVQRATSNPEHPFAKFSVGNLDTLADRDGQPVWDDLKALYDAEYSANRMTLAVIGTQSLDELEALVRPRFVQVKSHGKPAPRATVPLFTPEQLGAEVLITPLADIKRVELQFPVPPALPVYESHPIDYLTRLIGHEGEGSLYVHLRDAGLIESLSASTAGTEDTTLVTVRIALTDAGWFDRDRVIASVFQYLHLLRKSDLPALYHNESATIARQSFTWANTATPVSAVNRAVGALHDHAPEKVLDYRSRYGRHNTTLVRSYLERLTPDNLHLLVVGPDLETDQVEPRYDAAYRLAKIDAERLDAWRDPAVDPALHLPAPNPFIASALVVKPAPDGEARPTKLIDEAGLELWHHHDDSFGVPKARVQLDLFTPATSSERYSRLETWMLASVLTDSLRATTYPAAEAGLSLAITNHGRGLRVSVSGFDPKVGTLLDAALERIQAPNIDEGRFEVLKARGLRALRNRSKARPINQGRSAMADIMDPGRIPAEVSIAQIEALTVEDVRSHAKALLEGSRVRMLVHGNLTQAEATSLAERARALVSDQPAAIPPRRARRIPSGSTLVQDMSIDHDDSILVMHYRADAPGLQTEARWRVLGALLKTPFFTEIRTNQQLGYNVYATYTATDTLPGLRMGVQSSAAGPKTLQDRIDTFVADHHRVVQEMDAEAFETIKTGLITRLLEKDTSLFQRSNRYASALWRGYWDFDRSQRMADAVRAVTHEEMVRFYEEQLLSEQVGRVIVRSAGHAHVDERSAKPDCTDAACVAAKMPDVVEREM